MEALIYPQLLNLPLLQEAWADVLRKGSAGGIDQESLLTFEETASEKIQELLDELSAFAYTPLPYYRILIPKDDHEFRSLGLLSVRDKIVQVAVRKLIEPLFERDFLPISYGYRPGKGHTKAIGYTKHLIMFERRNWVLQCDIDSYFDNVSHRRLLEMLLEKLRDERIVNLIKVWIQMGAVNSQGKWFETQKGVPQGAILSPLLSNIYLHPFDKAIHSPKQSLVRYADDFVVLTHQKDDAQRAFEQIRKYLTEKLDLSLNADHRIIHVNTGFEFLGILFQSQGVSISPEKFQKLCTRLAEPIAKLHEGVLSNTYTEAIRGIEQYYAKLIDQHWLQKLDRFQIEKWDAQLQKGYTSKKIPTKEKAKELLQHLTFLSTQYTAEKSKTIDELLTHLGRSLRSSQFMPLPVAAQVQKRKREFQKKEVESAELVVMTPGAFVAKAQKRIVVRHKGLKVADIATAGLRNISILAAGVSLSSSLIQFCMQHDISIDFIDFKGVPYAKIIDFEHFSASVGIAQLLALHNGIGAHIALKIIEGKISNQMSLLKYLNKYRGRAIAGSQLPTYIAAMQTTRAELKPLIAAIDQGQTINLAELRGKVFSIEGRSAQYYWKGVAEVLQTKVAFEGRERQGATDLVNSMLNYGYALLYSRVWSAVLKAGLNPNISYLHAEQINKPTLIYDLVEEFRAHVVDRPLLAMLVKEHLPAIEKGLLTDESRRRIVDKVIRKLNAYEQFRGKEMTLSDIIKHQAGAVADCIMQKNTHYKPYLAKW